MITGRQIRAARALLDMSQDDLAEATGLTPQAIRKIESGESQPREGTLADITRAFHDRGVEFTDNSGVKLKPSEIEVLEGTSGFSRFYDYLYEHVSHHGGDLCVSGVDERLFSKYHLTAKAHAERMTILRQTRNDIRMQILIEEGDYNFIATGYAAYRWQKKEHFSATPFYVFGDCLALISFSHDPAPQVILIKSATFAQAYRQAFALAWQSSRDIPEK